MNKETILLYCGTIWGVIVAKTAIAMATARPFEALGEALLLLLVGIVWKNVRDNYPEIK